MRDIYAFASRVEVWLGEASAAAEHALGLVRKIGSSVKDAEGFLGKGSVVVERERFAAVFARISPNRVRALNQLFQRPRWTRVWVVQELSVANQTKAEVTCGGVTVKWLDLLICAYAIEACWEYLNQQLWNKFPDDALDGFTNGLRMAQCRYVKEGQPRFHLLELLQQHRDCEATSGKDNVYGLLGLAGDAEQIGLVPDYIKSIQQHIYRDLVKKHVRATKSLDIICACRGERKVTDLPSWVPDWSTDQVISGICLNERLCGGDDFEGSSSSGFQRYRAAGSSQARVSFNPAAPGELITKGFSSAESSYSLRSTTA